MTDTSADQPIDNTRVQEGAAPADPADAAAGVRGGSADRMDSPGEGSGGVPAAGADGSTGAREQLRKDLGERPGDAEEDTAGALAQNDLGQTDDPATNSLGDRDVR
jgi:hypothetical protein